MRKINGSDFGAGQVESQGRKIPVNYTFKNIFLPINQKLCSLERKTIRQERCATRIVCAGSRLIDNMLFPSKGAGAGAEKVWDWGLDSSFVSAANNFETEQLTNKQEQE